MGVSWVILYRSAENIVASRAEVERQLETLGAKKVGTFLVDSLLYIPTNADIGLKGPRPPIHVSHHSEYPMSTFSFIGDNVGVSPYLVSDKQFDGLVVTMQGAYVQKSNSTVECKGLKFALGDFLVFLGDVIISGTTKGLLVQIEFPGSVIASSCFGMLQELTQTILGPQVGIPQHVAKFKPNQKFSPVDTVIQYVDHFVQFRKSQQVAEMAAQQGFGMMTASPQMQANLIPGVTMPMPLR